ncbi:hypothetical protein D3C76_1781770 [compost metagenome]
MVVPGNPGQILGCGNPGKRRPDVQGSQNGAGFGLRLPGEAVFCGDKIAAWPLQWDNPKWQSSGFTDEAFPDQD